VALVLNGCCGNIHHTNHLDPRYKTDHLEMGRKLTQTTGAILPRLQRAAGAPLAWKSSTLRIPLRRLSEQELDAARRLLAEHPEPMWRDDSKTSVHWDWVYAASIIDLFELSTAQPFHDYEVQAFRIGNSAIVGLNGEPFVEGQLEIKLKSPAPFTFVAHMCNGYVGYVPTYEAFKHGGYETRTGNWSRLAPEALSLITDESLRLLKELFTGLQEAQR
jgi:hypothetical protein